MAQAPGAPEPTVLHDAIHGPITLGPWDDGSDLLARLTRGPELGRLRRIKQLGFASYAFPAADHSRYAHSLGTLHVMRLLLAHRSQTILRSLKLNEIRTWFPEFAELASDAADLRRLIERHMLLAALLQDIGELPFSQATERIVRPAPDLKAVIREQIGTPAEDWSKKDAFTAGCLCHSAVLATDDIDMSFLVFLATGHLAESEDQPSDSVLILRQILDGAVDADRLDYVYRDAYHTIGHVGGPTAVIESLERIEPTGPVFAEPGPVLDFLSTRASLWSRVYVSPENRFWIVLLREALNGIVSVERCRDVFFSDGSDGNLSIDGFLAFDDTALLGRVANVANDPRAKLDLARQPRGRAVVRALDLFLEGAASYEAEWLPPATREPSTTRAPSIPDHLFFDTYADYRHHRLYEPASVRVSNDRYRNLRPPVELERCSGPLGGILFRTSSPLAVPDSVLLFKPRERRGREWDRLERAIEEGSLHAHLLELDPDLQLARPDTRNADGFSGPAIFISYAGDDKPLVERLTQALIDRGQRYFLLASALQGRGVTAGENSVRAVRDADAAIIVVSSSYAQRYGGYRDGNIAKEVFEMAVRRRTDQFPIAFLSADPYEAVRDALPWSQLGAAEVPLFEPLRTAPDALLARAVDRALEQIAGNPTT